jgi:hypothetical protein
MPVVVSGFQIVTLCRSFVVEQKNGALHATGGTEPKPSSRYRDCYVKGKCNNLYNENILPVWDAV